jgi:hypothetical protein
MAVSTHSAAIAIRADPLVNGARGGERLGQRPWAKALGKLGES